ncbi:hypothetical protein DFP72DRAFT_413142 [Ephemerocybe angulata]|uniref:Uncharacterized protein n=1 Tax=Ephemerocybe angulata TaxID=980116 RepID=A0A8H6IEF3_9AGAR|nr:hypothetical protein DFP72DRAFT_413142 [Tulosesus angulatus]
MPIPSFYFIPNIVFSVSVTFSSLPPFSQHPRLSHHAIPTLIFKPTHAAMDPAQEQPRRKCGKCTLILTPSQTKSNANKNAGRWYVQCFGTASAPHTHYFYFTDGQGSRRSSPVSPSAPRFDSSPSLSAASQALAPSAAPASSTTKPMCGYNNCTTSRLNKKCPRGTCSKHCRLQHGRDALQCPVHALSDSDALQSAVRTTMPSSSSAPVVDPTHLVPLLPPGFSYDVPVSAPTPPPVPAVHKQYAVQIRPAIAEQYAGVISERAKRDTENSARKEADDRLANTINVTAWVENDQPPMEAAFQVGITPGLLRGSLTLSEHVLSSVGLEGHTAVHWCNVTKGSWVKLEFGFIVPLGERTGQPAEVLIKSMSVTRCLNFEVYLAAARGPVPPGAANFRSSTVLTQERSVVKAKDTHHFLTSNSLLGSQTRSSPSIVTPAKRPLVHSSPEFITPRRPSRTANHPSSPVDTTPRAAVAGPSRAAVAGPSRTAYNPSSPITVSPPRVAVAGPSRPLLCSPTSYDSSDSSDDYSTTRLFSTPIRPKQKAKLVSPPSPIPSLVPRRQHAPAPVPVVAPAPVPPVVTRVFPEGFYVWEVAQAVEAVYAYDVAVLSRPAVFLQLTGCVFKSSTVNDAKVRWEYASLEQQERFMSRPWPAFCREVPFPSAEQKALKKRIQRRKVQRERLEKSIMNYTQEQIEKRLAEDSSTDSSYYK